MRADDCDIVIASDKSISRVHAHLILPSLAPEAVSVAPASGFSPSARLLDQGSKFGSHVNMQRVPTGADGLDVRDGDTLQFGNTQLKYVLPQRRCACLRVGGGRAHCGWR